MGQPQPPKQPQTILNVLSRAIQTVQARINFSQLALKPHAKVPELRIQDAGAPQPEVKPLLGDYYTVGRSSKSTIMINNPIISSIHLSISRPNRGKPFVIKDEGSTNGIYRGKQKITAAKLRHGDVITLGPPELAASVTLTYLDPPPWYARLITYGIYGLLGLTILMVAWMGLEWTKFDVRPLPRAINGPVIIYSRDGTTPLRPLNKTSHDELKRLRDFSPYLPKAVIASEDSRYYWHLGVDPLGILRAVLTNLRGGEIKEGASTLTQQLARSLFRDYVGTQDSAGRKLREAAVALKLETFYSKDKLLLTYLNQVYLGINLYGFEDASRFYFDKSAKDLDLSEAATLVGILPAPNSFNPVRNYDLAVEYRNRVIERMRAMGLISQEEADRSRRSRIEINPKAKEFLQSTIAPYFFDYIFDELEILLGKDLATEGNFFVETGLNVDMQEKAEVTLRDTINNTGSVSGFSQGALISLNNQNGEILAMTGGVDYEKSQFNRATQAKRQPGSTFKVFAYAAALEKGISTNQSYSCSPLNWEGQNFSGCQRTSGDADMYRSLAMSENVIALRIAQDVGLDKVLEMARRLGIKSKLDQVPGLILGQNEVNLLEMTGSYAVFANHGKFNQPHAIKKIFDSSDCKKRDQHESCRCIYSYIEDSNCESHEISNRPVFSPGVADTITSLLQSVISSGTGKNASLGFNEAGKTGTTNDYVDLWFIGYIPSKEITTGVWLGNDDNTPTGGGSENAAQLWGDYMRQVVRSGDGD